MLRAGQLGVHVPVKEMSWSHEKGECTSRVVAQKISTPSTRIPPAVLAGYRYTKSLLKLTVVGCGGAEKIKKHGWSFCPCWMPLLEFFHTLKVRFLEFVKFIISEV